jgi:signal peptidase I
MRRWVELFVIAVSMTVVNCSSSYSLVTVEGSAMQPSFSDGDRVLVESGATEIKRGDVVIFQSPKDKSRIYFKRVIGLPNESISIVNGTVYIDGRPLVESYVDKILNQTMGILPPLVIPEKNYFVLGDNRDNSSDSRSWGTVHESIIIGKSRLTF